MSLEFFFLSFLKKDQKRSMCSSAVCSKYLTLLSPQIIYVKPNEGPLCCSQSQQSSKLYAQPGSQGSPLFFDDAYALAHQPPYDGANVLLKAEAGIFGTEGASYEIGGRISYQFADSSVAILLGNMVAPSPTASEPILPKSSIQGVTLMGGTVILTNPFSFPTQLFMTDVSILNINNQPASSWIGITMEAGPLADLNISLTNVNVDAKIGQAGTMMNEYSTSMDIIQQSNTYQGLHVGQNLTTIRQNGTGITSNTTSNLRVSFPDLPGNGLRTSPGSAIDIQVLNGTLTRNLTNNYAITDSATVVSKSVSEVGTLNVQSQGNKRETQTGKVHYQEYLGNANVQHTTTNLLLQQHQTTTSPINSIMMAGDAQFTSDYKSYTASSKVDGVGEDGEPLPANIIQQHDSSVLHSTRQNSNYTNTGQCTLKNRSLNDSAVSTVSYSSTSLGVYTGNDPSMPSTLVKAVGANSSQHTYSGQNNINVVEMGTLMDEKYMDSATCNKRISNLTRIQGTPEQPSPTPALICSTQDSAQYSLQTSSNNNRYYCSNPSVVEFSSTDQSQFVLLSQNATNTVSGGASLIQMGASGTAKSSITCDGMTVDVQSGVDTPPPSAFVMTATGLSQQTIQFTNGSVQAGGAITASNTDSATQSIQLQRTPCTPAFSETFSENQGVWVSSTSSSSGLTSVDVSQSIFPVDDSISVGVIASSIGSGDLSVKANDTEIMETDSLLKLSLLPPKIKSGIVVLSDGLGTSTVQSDGGTISLSTPDSVGISVTGSGQTITNATVTSSIVTAPVSLSMNMSENATGAQTVEKNKFTTPQGIIGTNALDQTTLTDSSSLTKSYNGNIFTGSTASNIALRAVDVTGSGKSTLNSFQEVLTQKGPGNGHSNAIHESASSTTTLSSTITTVPQGTAIQSLNNSSKNGTLTIDGAILIANQAMSIMNTSTGSANYTLTTVTGQPSGVSASSGETTNFFDVGNMSTGTTQGTLTNTSLIAHPTKNQNTLNFHNVPENQPSKLVCKTNGCSFSNSGRNVDNNTVGFTNSTGSIATSSLTSNSGSSIYCMDAIVTSSVNTNFSGTGSAATSLKGNSDFTGSSNSIYAGRDAIDIDATSTASLSAATISTSGNVITGSGTLAQSGNLYLPRSNTVDASISLVERANTLVSSSS